MYFEHQQQILFTAQLRECFMFMYRFDKRFGDQHVHTRFQCIPRDGEMGVIGRKDHDSGARFEFLQCFFIGVFIDGIIFRNSVKMDIQCWVCVAEIGVKMFSDRPKAFAVSSGKGDFTHQSACTHVKQ